MLVRRLPIDSWTQTALRDVQPESGLVAPSSESQTFGPWSLTNYQLASLTDATNRVAYVAAVAGQLKPDPKPPAPTPRPGAVKEKVRALKPAQFEFLENMRANRQEA